MTTITANEKAIANLTTPIYHVMGSAGEDEHRCTWIVCSFLSLEAANRRCDLAKKRAHEIAHELRERRKLPYAQQLRLRVMDCSSTYDSNVVDEHFFLNYGTPVYEVETGELIEE